MDRAGDPGPVAAVTVVCVRVVAAGVQVAGVSSVSTRESASSDLTHRVERSYDYRMAENAIPQGKLAEIGAVIPLDQVGVGDVILFGIENGLPGVNEIVDADPVVTIDDKGIHFAGGTYIAFADAVEVYIDREVRRERIQALIDANKARIAAEGPAPKARWWNAGDAVVQWALNDPAVI